MTGDGLSCEMGPVNEKRQLRTRLSDRVAAMEGESRIVHDAGIATQITHLPIWGQVSTILGYLAMDDEVDLQAVLAAGRRAGKRVGLPRVPAGGGEMSFHEVADLRSGLERHPRGFLMPAATAPRIDAAPGTLILVPGRAFDRTGCRVGRGGGFYDRYLASVGAGVHTVGVAYAEQLVPSVPRESWDVAVQVVVTENETCFCHRPVEN